MCVIMLDVETMLHLRCFILNESKCVPQFSLRSASTQMFDDEKMTKGSLASSTLFRNLFMCIMLFRRRV